MEKAMIFLFFCVCAIFIGVYEIFFKRKKKYYSGLNYLIIGCLGLVTSVIYLIGKNDVLFFFMLCITLIINGVFGIIYRNKINDNYFLRIDYFSLYTGIIGLIPIFLYFIGYFHK